MDLVLAYCPLQNGYSVNKAPMAQEQILDGGLPRYRRLPQGPHKVAVNWIVKKAGFEYLNAFYNLWSDNPNQPFQAALLIDHGRLTAYECSFAGGMPPRLDRKNGEMFYVSAEFYVNPLPRNIDWDTFVVALGKNDPFEAQNALEKLVNKTLPEVWGNL